MNLHKDEYAFGALINDIHEKSDIRSDIIEKDYYVMLLLYELSKKQQQDALPAYFKGGTALYKALKSIRRFSEDIDITVCIDDCNNNSQKKKRLKDATTKYQSLPRTLQKGMEEHNNGSITTVYDYESIVHTADTDDPLQRFGHVKVEGTSFTVSEPHTALQIEPILYTYATQEQKQILQQQFTVGPFWIETIRLERIFTDKIFAAEFYYERQSYFDVAKHIYDVSVLMDIPQIQELLHNRIVLLQMVQYKRQEEQQRIGSNLSNQLFRDFVVFDELAKNDILQKEYQRMQKNYVFAEHDQLVYECIVRQLKKLEPVLRQLDESL